MSAPTHDQTGRTAALRRLAATPRIRTRLIAVTAAAATATALLAVPVSASGRLDTIPLPAGWQPEGIAPGKGSELLVGSIPTGSVLRVDARTARTKVIVPPRNGRAALGLKLDRNRIFVAGGPTGRAYVYDASTGADVANITLTTGPTLVNDVTVTRDAAFFTDSQRQQLYRLPLGVDGAPTSSAETLPITGDMRYDDDPETFEANGIVATPDAKHLLVVQGSKLFRVNPITGLSREVPIGGGDRRGLVAGDGLVLAGRTLYAVQNSLNRVAVVQLDGALATGRVTRYLRDSRFDFPTTIAKRGAHLFAVNLRVGTPPTPTTDYDIVRVSITSAKPAK